MSVNTHALGVRATLGVSVVSGLVMVVLNPELDHRRTVAQVIQVLLDSVSGHDVAKVLPGERAAGFNRHEDVEYSSYDEYFRIHINSNAD